MHFFLWGLLVTGIYIFLLPLGGYRPYRPVILRFDTVLPMNIFLIWLVSFSSYYLINHLQGKYKLLYLVPLLGVLGIFYQVDEFKFNEYECQNHSLYLMQTTTQPPVILNKDCPIFAWIPSEWDVHHNEVNNMLKRWGISTQSKEYHYK